MCSYNFFTEVAESEHYIPPCILKHVRVYCYDRTTWYRRYSRKRYDITQNIAPFS